MAEAEKKCEAGSPPRPDRCRTCRYWDAGAERQEADVGECRRMPPQAGEVCGGRLTGLFPETDPDDWCGEWKAV